MASARRATPSWALALSLCLFSTACMGDSTSGIWRNGTTRSLEEHNSQSRSPSVLSTSSVSSPAAKSNDLGAFVAAGMGMTRSSDIDTTTITSASSMPLRTADSGISSLSNATSHSTSNGTTSALGNHTVSFTGDCWDQWSQYWSANHSATRAFTYSSFPTTTTFGFTLYSDETASTIYSGTVTTTVYNGAHPQKTFTTVVGTSTSISFITKEPTKTFSTTRTWDDQVSIDLSGNNTFLEPSCSLPSYVPACQSSWDDWVLHKYGTFSNPKPAGCTSNVYSDVQAPSCSAPVASWKSRDDELISLAIRDKPSCTQARVTGTACSTLVTAFLENAAAYQQQSDGVVGGGMNYTTYTTSTGTANEAATITSNVWFWDPSSTFAPGCTLGCQSCQINGGTVQLIYWPPESSTWINGNYSAITGNHTGLSTVVTLGTTLTSPTVYVSFDSLYARDSCSAYSKTYTDQIVAITNTANLSSLYGWGRYNGLGSPASFNFTDL